MGSGLEAILKSGLYLGTTPFKMSNLGHNHWDTGLYMQLEAYNHSLALSCMRLGSFFSEKEPHLRDWALGVVLWSLNVM